VQDFLPILILLLATLALVVVVAPRMRTPLPVLLALAGAALTFIPGLPHKPLDPDLILVAFLPPLLYADAFDTSWVDFVRWLRPIVMLAVVLVALTIVAVGLVCKQLLPELPYPVCFLLGAIVSPTDTVAVQSAISRLRISRRVTAIVGGESLVNDATGLVGVQIAVAVIASGSFSAGAVALSFARVAGLGLAIGAATGIFFTWVNRRVHETRALFVCSLLAPYLAFQVAHHLGGSGVLAVVVAGFVVSWNIHTVPPDARVELYSAWQLIVDVLNGLCFVFIGLEAPRWLGALVPDGGRSLVLPALGVTATLILLRILVCYPSSFLPLWLSPRLRKREGGYAAWQGIAIVSWCGVRGIVSLAAALALPATLPDGSPFPGRETIVALTMGVILITLVGQGATLLPLIRLLGLRDDENTAREVRHAREQVLQAGIQRLDAFCSEVSCPIAVHHWRALLDDELAALKDEDVERRRRAEARVEVSAEVHRAVAAAQATALLSLRDHGSINDKTYLELQLELDRANFRPREALAG
jgi:monovalent cation/hydrogen antiporter